MATWKRQTSRSRLTQSALMVSVVALIVAGATYASVARSAQSKHATASNGLPGPINPNVSLSARDQQTLARLHAEDPSVTPGAVALLKTVGGSSFYDVHNATGVDCFSVGTANATDELLGSIGCGTGFPSASDPVLDFTVMHGAALSSPTPTGAYTPRSPRKRVTSSDPASARSRRADSLPRR
jgi:hypothetical protein